MNIHSGMTIDQILSEELAKCDEAIAKAQHLKKRLGDLVPVLSALPSLRYCYYYAASNQIILGVRTRDDWAAVRGLHRGVWEKKEMPEGDAAVASVRYEAVVDGVTIDCRVDDAPPSCRIEETVVDVPACKRIVRKLVCNEPSKETAAEGQIVSVDTKGALA